MLKFGTIKTRHSRKFFGFMTSLDNIYDNDTRQQYVCMEKVK